MLETTEQYNIFELGFNKYLSKELSVLGIGQNDLSMPSIMGSSFLEIPPSQMGSGELVGNITMVAGLLQSYNFVTGSTGWQINYDGDVEFNSGVFRGSLVAGSIHIPDQDTTANSFHTDSDGNSWWGCTETNFNNDNDNANAYILKTGVAKFQSADITGAITINSGSGIANLTDAGSLAVLDAIGASNCNSTIISGGKIITGLLTASNIVTGTLTGLTVQTATSGKRLRMQGSPANEYQFLDSATKVGHLKIDDDGSGGYFAQIYIDYLGPVIEVGSVTGASPSVYFNAPFFESYGRSAIGQVSLLGSNTQVGLGWSGGATATWSFDLGTDLAKVSSNIVPSSTYDLGTSGDEWNKLWVDEINLNGTSKTAWPAAGVTAHGDLTGVTSSQHHVKYSDANARSAIINYNLSGDLQLNAHDLETVKYLKFHASYGKIYVGSTEIINFYSTTKVQFKKPVELGGENLTETGTILPEGTASKNLGGSSNNWEDLYLEGDVYSNGSTQIIALDNDTTAIQVLNRDFIPSSDDAVTCGRYNQRWSDTRTVKFNGSDYGFENDWYLTEHDRVGIKEVGIAVLDSDDELKLFIGESGLYVKGGNVKNLDILPYVKTTIEQRVRMDNHPELRNRTKDKVILGLPDPKDAKIGGGKYIENKITMKKNKEIKSNKK